ncbi:hypothetical protein CHS0354_000509 [Potamilus streckersoni]|uniref:Uncharacterized protein n=1 Tax=Potamilus streckersoni TaxID=2493646 RepID=A0AAE0W903_9BIVA|nr:hypothetical protein CHS0354_000509 [Potamilus streckersoni]
MDSKLIMTATEAIKGLNLTNKVYLVTGGYAGLGTEAAKALLKANAKIIIVGRNAETQQKFVTDLLNDKSLKISQNQIDAEQTMDLGSLESVSKFAKHIYQKYEQIETLMLNAGIMRTPAGKTKDGFEIQMGTNSKLKMIPKIRTGQIKIKKPEEGASTQVFCSVTPYSELENGCYYADCKIEPSSKSSNIAGDAKKLYDYCDEVTKKYQ